MSESGYLLIANSEAGTAQRESVAAAERILGVAGDVETVWTSSADDLGSALADIDGRTVVVAGGDGSIHLLVNQLDRMGLLGVAPVGLLPLGTGNDLARGLDLPLDPVEAARRIVDGKPRSAPLLRVSTGDLSTNNAHLGIGVAAAERAASLKPKLGRLAYTVGGIVAGVRHGSTPLTVEVDGRLLHDGPAAVVFAALGPSVGGGHELANDVDVLAPVVDVFVVTATSLRDRLRLLPYLARNDVRAAPSVLTDRGSDVTLTLERETSAEIDGEFRSWSGTISLTVEPGAWSVVL